MSEKSENSRVMVTPVNVEKVEVDVISFGKVFERSDEQKDYLTKRMVVLFDPNRQQYFFGCNLSGVYFDKRDNASRLAFKILGDCRMREMRRLKDLGYDVRENLE